MVALPSPTFDLDLPAAAYLSVAGQTAQEFLSAVNALTKVTTFTYTPAYEEDATWGQSWRRIQFHSYGVIGYGTDEDDADCDALQLFVALCAVSSAPNSLESIKLSTKGYAFWGVPPLHRLLHRTKEVEDRDDILFSDTSFYDDAFDGDDLCFSTIIREI
ncbi:hypothetical protein LTR56_026159 [Elasticomyces elasticus]|nr:hypothetical protein LTR56_026159 [Elasticomyces elasticus]KAK4893546.1 hypothetical protein LTR49_028480 [Elasticomyces elasticus]KAK5744900.1 hypothetical protein LTS12_023297 [Elasticomyces elasticus]